MTYSDTFVDTETDTITITQAKHVAAKIFTDLMRMSRYYGSPSSDKIEDYYIETYLLVQAGYLAEVKYGFKKSNRWIEPTACYRAREVRDMTTDDNPGNIPARADIEGASFYSLLSYTSKWYNLSNEEKENFNKHLPFQRGTAKELPQNDGRFVKDKNYTSGNAGVERSMLRSD